MRQPQHEAQSPWEQPLWRLLLALSIPEIGQVNAGVLAAALSGPAGERRVALAAAFGRLRHPVVAAM